MDPRVIQAMQQWPNVPDVYGWLGLDRRGRWLMRGEHISNPKLIDFISRNYIRLESGGYAFQNGPQRVHVSLETTPWIAHVEAEAPLGLVDHTGQPIESIKRIWLTTDGQFVLEAERGPNMVVDQDLVLLLAHLRCRGTVCSDEQLEKSLSDPEASGLQLLFNGNLIGVQSLRTANMASALKFIAHPKAS